MIASCFLVAHLARVDQIRSVGVETLYEGIGALTSPAANGAFDRRAVV
jgi:hypothetical protein